MKGEGGCEDGPGRGVDETHEYPGFEDGPGHGGCDGGGESEIAKGQTDSLLDMVRPLVVPIHGGGVAGGVEYPVVA